MRQLMLADYGRAEGALQLAREWSWIKCPVGIEVQGLYFPDVLDDMTEALAAYQSRLADFDGPISLHGPFMDLVPGSPDALIRQATLTRFTQALEVAAALHASHVVIHNGYIAYPASLDKWVARAASVWRAVLPHTPEGTRIHLENLLEQEPAAILELLSVLDDPRMGICLDIGHAHFYGAPVLGWVQKLGARITYVHLHDNHGVWDEHLPLGQGNIPLMDVLGTLEERAPDAIWSIEAPLEPSLTWLHEHGFLPT